MQVPESEFLEAVVSRLGIDPEDAEPMSMLVADLGLTSVQLFELALILDEYVPGFELPQQLAIGDVRLCDVHYYLTTAAEHRAEASARRTPGARG